MKMIGRFVFYLVFINELTFHLRDIVRRHYKVSLDLISHLHLMALIVEHTNTNRIAIDIAPEFSEQRISNAMYHNEYLRASTLARQIPLFVVSELYHMDTFDIGTSMSAQITVLRTLNVMVELQRTGENRCKIIHMSWRHNWLGLIQRAMQEESV